MKKALITTCLLALTALASAAQFALGGHRAVLDRRSNVFLCSIDTASFAAGSVRLTFEPDGDAHWRQVTIGGRAVQPGQAVEFDSIAGGRTFALTAEADTGTLRAAIAFTFLPILELNGDFGYSYQPGTVTLHLPDGTAEAGMTARVKWRGATSNSASAHKRNYHIKFVDSLGQKQDRRFFGLRNDNSWLLDAGQSDMFRVRNRVATELWNDMARAPYHADSAKQVHTGVRGRLVEVVLNGSYNGFYSFTEAMDRKQLRLKKFDEDSLTIRGQLWKVIAWNRVPAMYVAGTWNNDQATCNSVEVKYPDPDDLMPTDWSTLARGFDFVGTSSDSVISRQVDQYFDMPVMIDYAIFIEVYLALDNSIKNLYWYCPDRTRDPRLSLAVWDLDETAGQGPSMAILHNSFFDPETDRVFGASLFMNLIEDSLRYRPQVLRRYRELRQSWLATDSLTGRYRHYFDQLTASGAAARETARWSGDSDLGGHQLDFAGELDFITQWLTRRLAYLDSHQFNDAALTGDLNGDGVVNTQDVTLLVAAILAGDSLPAGDLDGNGVLNAADVTLLVQIITAR